MAIEQRRPVGVIHHSDQGCQHTSLAFGKRCPGSIGPRSRRAMSWKLYTSVVYTAFV